MQAAFENQKKDDLKKTVVISSREYYLTGATLMGSNAKLDVLCFAEQLFVVLFKSLGALPCPRLPFSLIIKT